MSADAMVDHLARLAMDHIDRERARGFPDLQHRMVFKHQKGFTGATEVQIADVFMRAIIADALCDARELGGKDLAATLDSECRYLIEQRRRSGCGGWSYFPGLPELPADIDDLAEVMQVLTRCERRADLTLYAEPPLEVVLRDNGRPNGAFQIWIIPKQGRSKLETRQAHFVETVWGDTEDAEVVANFIFALMLYEPMRFCEIVQRGLGFVEDQQTLDGSWQSTWYVGPYYGTYVCVRALAEAGRERGLARARSFLSAAQRRDGGWGKSRSCQLDTALALCGLCAVAGRLGATDKDRDSIARGIQALTGAQAVSSGWDAPPFMRIEVGRARGRDGPDPLYGSSTVTAAYALKATMAVRHMMAAAPDR